LSTSCAVAPDFSWRRPRSPPRPSVARPSPAIPKDGLAVFALASFLVAVAASVYVLLPKAGKFVFAMVGAGLYEGLYEVKDDSAEVYRRLAYQLDRFWKANDVELQSCSVRSVWPAWGCPQRSWS
jgi:hypothetical protein